MKEGMLMRAGDQNQQSQILQAEHLTMAKKRNSVKRYARHLQLKVMQVWFGTVKNSSIQKST